MKITIITPSLQRQSLIRCCESVNNQTHSDWQHVVAMDCAPEDINHELVARIQHPQRVVFCCGEKFGHYGNHARWMAWEKASGDYLLGVDDDNSLYTEHALADISAALESTSRPDFAIFPIQRHGRWFFYDPPGLNMTDTANVVVRREFGRWPDILAREADGHFVDALKATHDYAAFPNVQPIVLMEASSNGI